MPSRKSFTPFDVVDDLDLRVVGFANVPDETRIEFAQVGIGEPMVESAFDLTPNSWTRVRIDFVLAVPRPPRAITRSSDQMDAPLEAIVCILCRATKVRRSVQLTRGEDGRYRGSAVVDRSVVKNVVRLVPQLVVMSDGDATDGPQRERGDIIGSGRGLQLRVDHQSAPFEGGLDVRWEDFRASNDDWRKRHAKELYSMDFGEREPVLWLNARYANVQAVLHGAGETPMDAAMKGVANTLIGQAALHQLFAVSAGDLVLGDSDEQQPELPEDWRGVVLAKLLPAMYPEVNEGGRLGRLVSELGSDASAATVATRLGTAIQVNLKVADAIARAMRVAAMENGA